MRVLLYSALVARWRRRAWLTEAAQALLQQSAGGSGGRYCRAFFIWRIAIHNKKRLVSRLLEAVGAAVASSQLIEAFELQNQEVGYLLSLS